MARRDASGQEALGRPGEGLAPTPRVWVPAGFVLFSLFALLLAPLMLNARAASLRSDVANPGSDARGEINDVRHAITSGEAAIRGLLLTGDERFLSALHEARSEERLAFDRLVPLAGMLDPDLAVMVHDLQARSDQASEARAALLDELRAGRIPTELLAREEERYEDLLRYSAAIKAQIVAHTEAARATIRQIDRLASILTLVLAMLALVAAALVLRTSRTHRLRAKEEAELRAAAFSLTEATEVGDVLRRIALSAARIDRGESSYVERVDRDSDDVEVVAGAGPAAPVPGVRVPYPGSLTHEAAASGDPEIVPDIARLDRPISRVLAAACGRCVALVIPLFADAEPEGALVIIRPARATFTDREVEQRRVLGILAALALRKTVLLERAQAKHDALQNVVRSRERLIRGFSHDVKNPLGAADGHAQLLADGVLGEIEPRQKESVQRIRSGIASALELIGNLIDLARSEDGQLDVRTEPVDVATVARDTARAYAAASDAVGLRLETDLDDSIPHVQSDPRRIAQVLGNLLSNAIKYTPPGGTVRLSAVPRTGRRAGDPSRWVTLAVQDTGPGIPAEQQDQLFHEFHRLDPGSAQGEGLGLAISDRIARLLGGEITLDSKVGQGSTFTLWLPAGNHS